MTQLPPGAIAALERGKLLKAKRQVEAHRNPPVGEFGHLPSRLAFQGCMTA